MLAALEAQRLLADDHEVAADVWSATSYQQLRDDALTVERWNRLHPTDVPRRSYLAEVFDGVEGPVVAVTDFVKAVPDQIARWVPPPFVLLGTDGFGLSDARAALRRHFEVDAAHIVVAALHGLAECGEVKAAGRRRRHRRDTASTLRSSIPGTPERPSRHGRREQVAFVWPRASAAWTSAAWVRACGKLPRCSPVTGSISSPNRPSGPPRLSSWSNMAAASL